MTKIEGRATFFYISASLERRKAVRIGEKRRHNQGLAIGSRERVIKLKEKECIAAGGQRGASERGSMRLLL